jgi:large subunit ribosomal protein L3
MATIRQPRSGSLQFWPRKKAKKPYARIRYFKKSDKPGLSAFSGYKVGMTHVTFIDNKKTSKTKGEEVTVPVTIVECPPIKIISVRFYKKSPYGLRVAKEIMSGKLDKVLERKIVLQKKKTQEPIDSVDPKQFDDIRVKVYTQPKLTSIGRKKPEVFELALGGSIDQKFAFVKDNFDKEIPVSSVFHEGQQVDIHGITKGKGFQGTTKRFGTSILPRKTEKDNRGIATLGPWHPAKVLYTVNQPGKHGYFERTHYNHQIMKISEKPEEIQQNGGFLSYGTVKNTTVLIKGSLPGPKKRLVIFTHPIRQIVAKDAPAVEYVDRGSKQGR